MRKLRWLVPVVVGTIFMVACGSLQATPPELSEEIGPAEVNGCIDCEPFMKVDLLAGQDMKVGTVTVTNDDEQVCVRYALDQDALDAGWLLYETHLYVGATDDFPGTKINERLGPPYNSNPIPGQFPYGDPELGGEPTWGFCISLADLGVQSCDEVFVAAHAVVKRTELLAEAPYGGSTVVDTLQAWRIDHTPEVPRYVSAQRSDPVNALTLGTPGQVTFYSLGYGGVLNAAGTAVETFFGASFENTSDPVSIKGMESLVTPDLAAKLTDTENNAGWIVIEFDPPALNVDGAVDLQVVEDTWGLPYPLELAAVFGRASADDDWTFLFLAHNQQPVGTPTYHTYTNGSMGALEQVAQVLVQDVTDPVWFAARTDYATLDGFDLNAVLALNDHEVVYEETAWGDGYRFNERGNWALWFTYQVCPPCVPNSIVYGTDRDGTTGRLWEIEFLDDGTIVETLLTSVSGASGFYPNGLAYDPVNHRLYYAENTILYMYDFTNPPVTAATGLLSEVYGATWGAGAYWYVRNASDDMYVVDGFDVAGVNGYFHTFETGFANKSFNFGDVAFDASEGVIYGSTSFSGAHDEFFAYDLTQSEGLRYSLITTANDTNYDDDDAIGLQIGFGEDGVLYGHNTFGSAETGAMAREWFAVGKTGTAVSLGIGLNAYNDLASGPSACD